MIGVVIVGIVLTATLARRAARATARAAARRPAAGAGRPSITAVVRRRWHDRLARRRGADDLPAVLEDVARSVRSGSSLRQACAEAAVGGGSARDDLAAVVHRADRGLPLDVALGDWARTSTSGTRLAAGALALAAAAGGPQARAVDGAAATLRDRRAIAGEVRAQSAQARLSALVIGVLPVAFLLWTAATDRRTAAFLVADPLGLLCLAAGLMLEAIGAWWMRGVVRSVTL